jgi:hypothetical protein
MNPTMWSKMKTVWIVISVITALCSPACRASSELPETEVLNPATPSQPNLETSMGVFSISSARLLDEIHDEKAQPGEKFLIVILTQPGLENLVPGKFSLESFQTMIGESNGQIYVLGKDSSRVISTMAGWIEDEFAMGFRVPIAESYTLYWPGNSPIELTLRSQ